MRTFGYVGGFLGKFEGIIFSALYLIYKCWIVHWLKNQQSLPSSQIQAETTLKQRRTSMLKKDIRFCKKNSTLKSDVVSTLAYDAETTLKYKVLSTLKYKIIQRWRCFQRWNLTLKQR